MSDEERESIKALLVGEVKDHLASVEKRKFLISIGTAVAVLGAIIYGTWVCNNTLHDLRDGQSRIESALNYKVSVGQFGKWVSQLEKSNRVIDPVKGLQVPDAPEPAAASSAAMGPN